MPPTNKPSSGQRSEEELISKQDILVLSDDDVMRAMGSSIEQGLSDQEAVDRLEKYGTNEVVKRRRRTGLMRFLGYFRDPLTMILLLAGAITLLTGDFPSSIIIFIIVLLSVFLQFIQERSAERASDELSRRVTTNASVVRGGRVTELPISSIVPGDIIHLSAGDIVPAGIRVVRCKDLFVDQSALTGESIAAEKSSGPISSDKLEEEAEWINYLFMGTSVVNGTAVGVAVRTGRHTRYAQIVEKLVAKRPETEFERGSRQFGYLIMRVTFALVVFVFVINVIYQRGLLESLLFSVALAVGLTPELLPMILTINLSKGAMAMSKKGVIVKRLESIQNYGSMDVLCTDKTGTLTENRVTLVQYVDVRGAPSDVVLKLSFLNSHFETGLRSPLDKAIIDHGGVDAAGYELVEEIPFDFQRKRVSVVVRSPDGTSMITKGAPEELLTVSSAYEVNDEARPLDQDTRKDILALYERMSADGLRLLGVSHKLVEERDDYTQGDEADLTFVGFVAFLDPPKESTREALTMLRSSGIEMKIITGDSELVTKKVCRELGFEIKGLVLGSELQRMDDGERKRAVEGANIFARVNPSQKNDIILALKGNGHVVGYLGDGVNDAPSIRAADVGISVDNAVDVAKEAADIILLKNDLRVLDAGVREGRRTFGNTMKYIQMSISSNFGNMFSAAGAALFLPFLPMLPLQILLNNLLYDLSESAIPTDNVDPEYTAKAKRLNIGFVRDFMVFFGPISSLFDILTFLVLIFIFQAEAGFFQSAWFVESICTQTLVVFAIRTARTPFFRSRPSVALTVSSLVVVAFALVVPFSPLAGLFHFVPLPIEFYIFLAIIVAVYIVLVDILKRWFYRRHNLDIGDRDPKDAVPNQGVLAPP